MQIVIKNGRVLATHDTSQAIEHAYPNAEIVDWGEPRVRPGDDDPRTPEQKDSDARDANRRKLERALYRHLPQLMRLLYKDQKNGTTEFSDYIDSKLNS